MPRQQMLCFVTPDAPAAIPRSITRRLDSALRAAGCVHFATLAWLPPAPGAPPLDGPSLLFELVVDEGIEAGQAIDVLLRTGFAVLWRLYRRAWTGPPQAGAGARRSWLRAHLLSHADAAACGFVGARDRSVRQILAEHDLLAHARAHLNTLARHTHAEPGELAAAVVRWARTTGRMPTDTARRSIWRPGTLPGAVRAVLLALRLVAPVLIAVGALALLGLLVAWLPAAFGMDASQANSSDVAIPLLVVVAVFGLLALLVLVVGAGALGPVLLLAGLALPMPVLMAFALGYPSWPDAASMFGCGVQLALVGAGALLAAGAGLAAVPLLVAAAQLRIPPLFPLLASLVLLAIAAAISFAASSLTRCLLGSLDCPGLRWAASAPLPLGQRVVWVIATLLAMALLLRTVIWLLPRLQRHASALLRWLDRPAQGQPMPLHQVHPSIDECEAALIGRQSHMISLTEIRRPVWLHRAGLKLSLWLVNQLADVYFTQGRLGNADGIKFGHWRIVGNGRRLLFCSNYDGSFGGYLDEFIRGASQGANLIWGRTELLKRRAAFDKQPEVAQRRIRFPKVRLLFFGGCKSEQSFKAYARASMLPHLYRFEAYNLSLQDIERATRLRDALCPPRSAVKTDQVLRALES